MSAHTRDLTSLIGSRICHDLISPLGAIGNGVELLNMSGSIDGPEMSLISESVENANARIRFFRVAFGAARLGQSIGQPEISGILADLDKSGRLAIDWQSDGSQPRPEVKLVFLLLLCLENAMPWGGHISVRSLGGNWSLEGVADRLSVVPALWEMLSAPTSDGEIDAAAVQFALAPLAADYIDRRLTVESSDTVIRVRF